VVKHGRMSLFSAVAILGVIAFLAPPGASAQVLYGSLVGQVSDTSGAVTPGATITITNRDTGLTRTAVSNETGGYSFTNVQPGPYDVKVTLQGFREFVKTGVPVSVNEVGRVDAALEVGTLTDTVTVASDLQLLQTDKADTHTEFKSAAITQLPLPQNRNYQSLINLVPGATPAAMQHTGPRPHDQREWSRSQQQRDQNRRRDKRQHLAAASHDAGLAGGNRRHGQRQHEQLRRRTGHGRRRRDYGHHQVGYQ